MTLHTSTGTDAIAQRIVEGRVNDTRPNISRPVPVGKKGRAA